MTQQESGPGDRSGPAPPAGTPGAALPWQRPTAPAPLPVPVTAPVLPPPQPTGRLLLAAVLVLTVLTGAALAAVWLVGGQRGAPPPVTPATTAATGTGAPAPSTMPARSSGPAADPNLIGADDFTGAGPRSDRWALYDSRDPNGAVLSSGMVRVVDGELRVVGTGRNPTGNGNRSGGLCWCGADGNRLYGRWQVRARFDAGAGYGQVIGLWPHSDSEVDGAISIATHEADRHTLHAGVVWRTDKRHSDEPRTAGDYTRWHVYTFEWRAGFVQIQVDGVVVYDSTRNPGVVIPHAPMHLYLQQTVGPKDGVPAADAHTPDEVVMHVDWVRVYR